MISNFSLIERSLEISSSVHCIFVCGCCLTAVVLAVCKGVGEPGFGLVLAE